MAEDDVIFEFRRSIVTSPGKQNAYESTKNSKESLKILGNFEKLFRRKLHDPSSGITTLNCCLKFSYFMYQHITEGTIYIRKSWRFKVQRTHLLSCT